METRSHFIEFIVDQLREISHSHVLWFDEAAVLRGAVEITFATGRSVVFAHGLIVMNAYPVAALEFCRAKVSDFASLRQPLRKCHLASIAHFHGGNRTLVSQSSARKARSLMPENSMCRVLRVSYYTLQSPAQEASFGQRSIRTTSISQFTNTPSTMACLNPELFPPNP